MITRSVITPILLSAALVVASCTKDQPAQAPVPTKATTAPAAKSTPKTQPAKPKGRTVQAGSNEAIYGLAPKNTILWFEIKSFEALAAAFDETVGDALQDMNGPSDPKGVLDFLQLMGLPMNKLQMDQPMALALSLELGSKEPNFTLLLPMEDSQNTAQLIEQTTKDFRVEARGRFVAISNSPSYHPGVTVTTALREVRGQGLLCLHVETSRLVDRFESELDQSLVALLAHSTGPAENEVRKAGAQVAVDTLSALCKGIKDMSLRVNLVDGELSVEGTANLRTGSRLTELGLDKSSNLGEMLRYVSLGRDELILGSIHKNALRFLGEPLVAMYGKHAVSMETKGVEEDFESVMGMVCADSVDLAFAGNLEEYKTDLAVFLNGLDSAALVARSERLVELNLTGLQDLTLMQPQKGVDENSRFAQYDLVAQAGSQAADGLEHLLGSPRVRLRLLGHGTETMVTLGEGTHIQNNREEKEARMPKNLAWALDCVGGANPAFVSHMQADHGYLDSMLQKLILGTEPVANEAVSEGPTPWITSYLALGSTQWRMGARMDLSTFRQQAERTARRQDAAQTK
ncbi:MAG: hypothetical protein GY930_12890 [bacterium]|nr:hypothetical protein [bacterium]